MTFLLTRLWRPLSLLAIALLITVLVYWPGLYGSWLFDDYPNIVDNHGVQPHGSGLGDLLNAALSSPASEFKRPLASLTFALNYLMAGLDPFWMKLTNLLIHLLNGVLVFVLARQLVGMAGQKGVTPPQPSPARRGGGEKQGPVPSTAASFAEVSPADGLPAMGPPVVDRRAADEGEARKNGQGLPLPSPPLHAGEGVDRGERSAGLPDQRRRSVHASGRLSRTEAGRDRETSAVGERRALPLPLPAGGGREGVVAAVIALGWLLLPINLTAVLYVVQRMESLANLFVLVGLIGYVAGRRRMLAHGGWAGFWLCALSITLPTGLGLLAKETAVLLPLYALAIEWVVFGVRRVGGSTPAMQPAARPAPMSAGAPLSGAAAQADDAGIASAAGGTASPRALPAAIDAPSRAADTSTPPAPGDAPPRAPLDGRILALFGVVLVLPMLLGLAWLLPQVLNPIGWTGRNFTLTTRLLSELRIVVDYIGWTLLPLPSELSFYHEDFLVSAGWLSPWTTLVSALALLGILVAMVGLRRRRPLVSLGIALFLACQTLTATILPLELIYEHRNYFASFGLMLALVPWLLQAGRGQAARRGVLAALLLYWGGQTAITAYAWGSPLRLAELLAERAPHSPRAQYELGRTYIMYSHYDPASPFTAKAYVALERAAALPESSILPQQALIFMNARMGLPLKDSWWDSMIAKLRARPLGVQDDSSLVALTDCARSGSCPLPPARMQAAFEAALSHPRPGARLLSTYADYAWSVLGDHALGQRMIERAIEAAPNEPAYRITYARMLVAEHRPAQAREQIQRLQAMNVGGRLDRDIAGLQQLIGSASP